MIVSMQLETWLESRGIDNVWDIAPGLINLNYTESDLSKLAERFGILMSSFLVS